MASKKQAFQSVLTDYARKRNFKKTPEPASSKIPKNAKRPVFVIQEHHASHWHHDFRLEERGVLRSWAVPKGIPDQKGPRHLAVETEDHPLGYAWFTGVIPEGLYGAGTVKIFDRGWFKLVEKSEKAYKVELHGKKLRGVWALVHFRPEEKNWLLFRTS